MGSKALFWLIAAAIAGDAAVPRDPLELVTGAASAVAPAERAGVLRLLQRARSGYALRAAGRAFDLKVRFTVNSGGQTAHDGTWEMEDWYDPAVGRRWTAKAADGYSITRISTFGRMYGEESGTYVPLRLAEARAALFGPMPPVANANRGILRATTALYRGKTLTCVLMGGRAGVAVGRRWGETEECIDTDSGLLVVHSLVPGRYYVYDYAGGSQLAGHALPHMIRITEAGTTVTTITVESLTELPGIDASLFAVPEAVRAEGRMPGLGGAQKVARLLGQASTASTVCVFGVVTAAGEVMEAHSLQPADPNSATAVDAVRRMKFARPVLPGIPPQQYFVFVIGRFEAAP
jgi:hypothetical protein